MTAVAVAAWAGVGVVIVAQGVRLYRTILDQRRRIRLVRAECLQRIAEARAAAGVDQ